MLFLLLTATIWHATCTTANIDKNATHLVGHVVDFSATYSGSCPSTCKPQSVSSSQQCSFINVCCNGTIDGGIVDYLSFEYCTMSSDSRGIGTMILLIILIYSFLIISNIADDYFAPITGAIGDMFGVSHNVAGVTFLAFGNGANDISASIAAIRAGGNKTLLGIGSLLGGATFDPIVISAVIALVCHGKTKLDIARRPFMRDCLFLCIAVSYVLFITQNGNVSLFEAISMWIIYLIYVLIVVLGEAYKNWVRKQRRSKRERYLQNKLENEIKQVHMHASARQLQIDINDEEDTQDIQNIQDIPHPTPGQNIRPSFIDRIMPKLEIFSTLR